MFPDISQKSKPNLEFKELHVWKSIRPVRSEETVHFLSLQVQVNIVDARPERDRSQNEKQFEVKPGGKAWHGAHGPDKGEEEAGSHGGSHVPHRDDEASGRSFLGWVC